MTIKRHGISIGIERIDEEFFLNFTVIGKLSHADYEFITPMLDSALAGVRHPKIRAYVDCTAFEGWELRAMWDDFRLGMNYGDKIEKAAVIGSSRWMEWLTKVGDWFTSADIRYFESESEARQWLAE